MLFHWPFQCFEAILRENGVIIENCFGRNCNPQFKAFQSKIFFPIKKFGFFTRLLHFILEKYFYWAVKKMMAMIAGTVSWYPGLLWFVWLLWFWGTTTDVWRVRLISARATAGLGILWGNLMGKLDMTVLLEEFDGKPGDEGYRGEPDVAQ
jgi:hypothetical protein